MILSRMFEFCDVPSATFLTVHGILGSSPKAPLMQMVALDPIHWPLRHLRQRSLPEHLLP